MDLTSFSPRHVLSNAVEGSKPFLPLAFSSRAMEKHLGHGSRNPPFLRDQSHFFPFSSPMRLSRAIPQKPHRYNLA